MLNERDQQFDGTVVVSAVDDTIVRMSVAGRNHKRYGGHAAVALLNFCRVVAVPDDKFFLQRDRLFLGSLPRERDKLAIGLLAGVVKKQAWTASQNFLCLVRFRSDNVVSYAGLQCDSDVSLHD